MAWYRTGGRKPEEEKSVTAGTSAVTVTPSQGKTMKKVTVNPTPTQSKTVTPNETQQMVEPDSGKHLASVAVNGDANLKAENIKKDVTIFGKTGTGFQRINVAAPRKTIEECMKRIEGILK